MSDDLQLRGVGMTSQRTRNRLLQRLREQGISDERVLTVIGETPRHLFVDEALSHRAYEDTALPIGYNQTISQPYIVARMTEILLAECSLEKVLEVGTGSGYQAAVLSPLVEKIFSVERIAGLHQKAVARFRQLGLRNIHTQYADGTLGWPSKGPFSAIIGTAAAGEMPPALIDQLAPGGCLLLPVGRGDSQELVLVRKAAEGDVVREVIERVKFVPMLGGRE